MQILNACTAATLPLGILAKHITANSTKYKLCFSTQLLLAPPYRGREKLFGNHILTFIYAEREACLRDPSLWGKKKKKKA